MNLKQLKFKEVIEKAKEKKIILIIALVVIIAFFLFLKFYSKDADFKTNAILLKSVIKRGDEITNNVKVSNFKEEKNFQLKADNLPVEISKDNFNLEKGEEKEVELRFKPDYFEYEPGVYVGKLVISTEKDKKEIPIILEIQSEGQLFVTNLDVAPQYKEVRPGEKTSVGIKVYNLKDTETHTLKMNSEIRSLDNEVIASETENIAVGTETLITKTISLPKDIEQGNYVFVVVTTFEDEYSESVTTSTYLFNISKKKSLGEFDISSLTIIFAIIVLIFLFGIIILVVYLMHERDKLFLELTKQHREEMRFYLGKIKKKETTKLKKVKKPREKKKIIREFKKIKKKAKKKIRERQREQKIIFKKLKKQKKKGEMKTKLQEWKKQGFNINELTAINKPMKNKGNIKDFKKQGYDISALKT